MVIVMKQSLCTALCIGLILTLCPVLKAGDPADVLSPERLNRLKAQYRYESWRDETGGVISGFRVSEDILPQIRGMENAWPADNYALITTENGICAEIRRCWTSGTGRLDVTLVVGPAFDAVKSYLISAYAHTSMISPPVRPGGRQFGLDIGEVCFVMPDHQKNGGFSSVDFIRHNVLFRLKSEGDVNRHLKAMAETLDALLMRKETAADMDQHPERPRIQTFLPQKSPIRLGEETALDLKVRQAAPRSLHYDWTLSGGGVRKDLLDQFLYYGGEEGDHQVTLTVINEMGLLDTASFNISVQR